jgi:hypothetical protein
MVVAEVERVREVQDEPAHMERRAHRLAVESLSKISGHSVADADPHEKGRELRALQSGPWWISGWFP